MLYSLTMGIVLGVEAVVGITEAAEAAAGTAEVIGGAAEAGETIAAGSEAGATAGTEAGESAAGAVEAGGDALSSVLETLDKGLTKLLKMAVEYEVIDAVFKAAKAILEALMSDPAAHARAKKLQKLIVVLQKSSTLMNTLANWIKQHAKDTTCIEDITVTIQGVLSKFLSHMGAVSACKHARCMHN